MTPPVGGEEVIAVWRRPLKGGAERAPLVVVLHGRGADEHDFLSVIDRLPREFTYASVRGPVQMPTGGYSWFESRAVGVPVAKSLRGSIVALRAWIDEVAPPAGGRPCYLFGFSAGMMMAGALLLDDPHRYAGAILLSGVIPLDCGLPAEPRRLADLPIFYGRGVRDDVIPAELVERSRAYLCERSGAAVALFEYQHEHTVSLREVQDIAAWLRERGG